MRLDHLLSRERARRGIGGFIPGRYTRERVGKLEESLKENPAKSWWLTVHLLEPVSFSGIERFLKGFYIGSCTLKTAQPDGKHLAKKPVAKKQFCSWSQDKRIKENL